MNSSRTLKQYEGFVRNAIFLFMMGQALGGCHTENPSPFVTYYQQISNETTHKVSLKLYKRAQKELLGNVSVAPQQAVVLEYKQEDPFTPFYREGRPDSVAIVFDDKYILANRQCNYGQANCPSGKNILRVSDYLLTNPNPKKFKYEYSIDENDFKLAK